MVCHAMSWSPCLRRCLAVPFLHTAPPLHFVPIQSSRRRAGRGGSLFRAYPARVRARVGAGAVRAPNYARETADALSLSVPAGVFGPSRFLQKTEKAAPQAALPAPIIPHFPTGQALGGPILKFFSWKGRRGPPRCGIGDLPHPSPASPRTAPGNYRPISSASVSNRRLQAQQCRCTISGSMRCKRTLPSPNLR